MVATSKISNCRLVESHSKETQPAHSCHLLATSDLRLTSATHASNISRALCASSSSIGSATMLVRKGTSTKAPLSDLREYNLSRSLAKFNQSQSGKSHHSHGITVVSFNVLAPCWASPAYFPSGVAPYLDRVTRRAGILAFLQMVGEQSDVIALQETTPEEFGYFQEGLKEHFDAFSANHDPAYWSEWTTKDTPHEPNGVAILVKKSVFSHIKFQDLPLTKDGNHTAYFHGIQRSTGKTVQAASIHLDSQLDSNRFAELEDLFKIIKRNQSSSPEVEIVAGDFNCNIDSGNVGALIHQEHFVNALTHLQQQKWTHPFHVEGNPNEGILDHIIARNLNPTAGQVLNSDLWELYPEEETERIIANLEISGSDHFPVISTFSH